MFCITHIFLPCHPPHICHMLIWIFYSRVCEHATLEQDIINLREEKDHAGRVVTQRSQNENAYKEEARPSTLVSTQEIVTSSAAKSVTSSGKVSDLVNKFSTSN